MINTSSKNPNQYYGSLEKETIPCEACGSSKVQELYHSDRYEMGLRTVICKICAFTFTNPRPTQIAMNDFYRTRYRSFYKWIQDPAEEYHAHAFLYKRAERLFNLVQPELDRTGIRHPSILDIGCGSGVLLHFFRRAYPTAKLYGVELDSLYADYAREKNDAEIWNVSIHDFLDQIKERIGSPDIILLNHVLEHLYHPLKVLKTLREILPKTGLFLIEVPNLISKHWLSESDRFHIAHVAHYTPSTLSRMVGSAGFSITQRRIKKLSVEPYAMTFLCTKLAADTPSLPLADPLQDIRQICKIPARIDAQNKPHLQAMLRASAWLKKLDNHLNTLGLMGTAKKAAKIFLTRIESLTYPDRDTPLATLAGKRARKKIMENIYVLRRLIHGNKILILGSGPSSAELDDIPDDVKIFTCNRGPKLLLQKGIARKIDLFMSTKGKINRVRMAEDFLKDVLVDHYAIDNQKFIEDHPLLDTTKSTVLYDDGMDDIYLKHLMAPLQTKDICGTSFHPWTSTGMRLLQYALYFGAAEVYLIGIDLGKEGYFWGENRSEWLHHDIDENFIQIMSERHSNIFSLSQKSPIIGYIPAKSFNDKNLYDKLTLISKGDPPK